MTKAAKARVEFRGFAALKRLFSTVLHAFV